MDSQEALTSPSARPLAFSQPKNLIRWLAVSLAVAGWYVSLQLLQVSLGSAETNPFLSVACPGATQGPNKGSCASVLTSPQGYLQIAPGLLKIPVSALGMVYFAWVGLWFLLVGPPTRSARLWHLCILPVVLGGAWASLDYIRIMYFELHRWCLGCLVVHALNGGLLVLTVLAYPWRTSTQPVARHPSPRLVLASVVAGVLALVAQVGLTFALVFGAILVERTRTYGAVLDDPAFIRWDYERQAPISIPPVEDEVYEGAPNAPETVAVFSDFQCPRCRSLCELLEQVMRKYPGRVRIRHHHYPTDAECNPYAPLGGAHDSACRAARAVEAGRVVGGPEAYLALRKKLYERQNDLPTVPYARQTTRQRELFLNWAAELGLDRMAFAAAMDAPAVVAHVQADVELGHRLDVPEIPTVYVNGKLLRNAQKMQAWDALLGPQPAPQTQPGSAPAER